MTRAPIHLRPIEPADDEFLCRVYASTRAEELSLVDWDEGRKAAFVRMQFDAQRRHYEEHYSGASFQVILLGDEPIGRFYVARWPEEVRIVDITLLPEHRGTGTGTGLLRQLQAEAHEAGKHVSIHVERFNPARHLYERLGFARVSDHGIYELMVWQAPPGWIRPG